MGCGWCGDRCDRQKECPGSWQQDHCPPEISEVQLTPAGYSNHGASGAWGLGRDKQVAVGLGGCECQKVLTTIFLGESLSEGMTHGKLGW